MSFIFGTLFGLILYSNRGCEAHGLTHNIQKRQTQTEIQVTIDNGNLLNLANNLGNIAGKVLSRVQQAANQGQLGQFQFTGHFKPNSPKNQGFGPTYSGGSSEEFQQPSGPPSFNGFQPPGGPPGRYGYGQTGGFPGRPGFGPPDRFSGRPDFGPPGGPPNRPNFGPPGRPGFGPPGGPPGRPGFGPPVYPSGRPGFGPPFGQPNRPDFGSSNGAQPNPPFGFGGYQPPSLEPSRNGGMHHGQSQPPNFNNENQGDNENDKDDKSNIAGYFDGIPVILLNDNEIR